MTDFIVTPDEGEAWECSATSRDVLNWERTNKDKRIVADLQNRVSMVDMYHLAWITSRRLGRIDAGMDLREFEKTHDIEALKQTEEVDEAAVDPTQPGPSGATSSRSP